MLTTFWHCYFMSTKISKFIAKTNVEKANITLKFQDSGEQSGPEVIKLISCSTQLSLKF